VIGQSSFKPTRGSMVKHPDRWPVAYYWAIDQLADVIAAFPPEKLPPSSCRRLQTIWKSLSVGDIAPITRRSAMPDLLITVSKRKSVSENEGEPARLWRPRHVHVRSLQVLINVAPRGISFQLVHCHHVNARTTSQGPRRGDGHRSMRVPAAGALDLIQ
jgi:hypothetical protein